jgi:hypothetical protein
MHASPTTAQYKSIFLEIIDDNEKRTLRKPSQILLKERVSVGDGDPFAELERCGFERDDVLLRNILVDSVKERLAIGVHRSAIIMGEMREVYLRYKDTGEIAQLPDELYELVQ